VTRCIPGPAGDQVVILVEDAQLVERSSTPIGREVLSIRCSAPVQRFSAISS
jgi:hypothetical protein